jgi:hypothetical protein
MRRRRAPSSGDIHRRAAKGIPQTFIKECRQKAWSAACHANWIGDQLDKFIEDYGKLKKDDETLEGDRCATPLRMERGFNLVTNNEQSSIAGAGIEEGNV